MKKDLYILYMLKVKKIKAIKIGITNYNRFDIRMKEIERDFGKIDLSESSYLTSSSMNNVKKIESSLHSIFWQFSKDLKKGSGHTEFFNDKIKKDLLKVISVIKKIDKLKLSGPFFLKRSSPLKYFFFLLIPFFCILFYYYQDTIFLSQIKDFYEENIISN